MMQRASSTILPGAEFGAEDSLDDTAGRSAACKFAVGGASETE